MVGQNLKPEKVCFSLSINHGTPLTTMNETIFFFEFSLIKIGMHFVCISWVMDGLLKCAVMICKMNCNVAGKTDC